MKKINLLLLALLSLGSCKDELDQPESFTSKNIEEDYFNINALYSTKHTISQKEAEEIALEFVNGPIRDGKSNSLKSTKTLKVAGTIVRCSGNGLKSKGQKQDTLGYFVNFADNNGYAYVCADDRVDASVLALFDNGNYKGENDTLIKPVYNMIDKYVSLSINKFEEKKEQRLFMVEQAMKNGELCTSTSKKQMKALYAGSHDYVYGPFIKATLGQGYNDYLPYCKCSYCTTNNKRDKVVSGCLAVALAQYQAYWGDLQSKYINNKWINCGLVNRMPTASEIALGRDYITREPKCQLIRYFFNQLSEAGGIDEPTHAYTSAKSSSIANVSGFLRNAIRETPHDFNSEKIITWLSKYNSPVFIEGKGVGTFDHVWLCDGVLAKYKFYVLPTKIEKKFCYFHYNWGWDGSNNGFFLDEVFVNTNKVGIHYDNESNDAKMKYEDLQMWGMAPYDYETKKPRYPYTDYWIHGQTLVLNGGVIVIP